jgi:small subunit ribosomal protein S3Ae
MAIGKNKQQARKKKGGSRKVIDPFMKKDWFVIKAPKNFSKRDIGHTLGTKTQGNRNVRDTMVGRVVEASLGDLKPNGEDEAFRKFKFIVQDIQGPQCLTSFYGMSLTTDKLRSLVKKWHTLIEAQADIKTTDGYTLRIFVIGFTKRRPNQSQSRKTCYAQSGQIRQIRKKMEAVITREASACALHELVDKLIPGTIGEEMQKATQGIYPLQNCMVRKVKLLKSPKTDLAKLMELHGGADAVAASASEIGKIVKREPTEEVAEEKAEEKAEA